MAVATAVPASRMAFHSGRVMSHLMGCRPISTSAALMAANELGALLNCTARQHRLHVGGSGGGGGAYLFDCGIGAYHHAHRHVELGTDSAQPLFELLRHDAPEHEDAAARAGLGGLGGEDVADDLVHDLRPERRVRRQVLVRHHGERGVQPQNALLDRALCPVQRIENVQGAQPFAHHVWLLIDSHVAAVHQDSARTIECECECECVSKLAASRSAR